MKRITSLKFRHLSELSLQNIISLFGYGRTLSTYLNLSVEPLLLLHWLWSIFRISYTTPTYFTQVLKIQHLISFITAVISGINYTHRQAPACAGTYRCTGKRYHYRQDLSGAGWHAGICPGLPIMPAIEYAGW